MGIERAVLLAVASVSENTGFRLGSYTLTGVTFAYDILENAMRRAFLRYLLVCPSEYRERFAACSRNPRPASTTH